MCHFVVTMQGNMSHLQISTRNQCFKIGHTLYLYDFLATLKNTVFHVLCHIYQDTWATLRNTVTVCNVSTHLQKW